MVFEVKHLVRRFICENFIVREEDFTDNDSMLEKQIIDSTGVLELVAFLEEQFGIPIADEDITPDNLDSVERICAFVQRKSNSIPSTAMAMASRRTL